MHKESSRKVLVQHFLVQILVQTFCYPCAVLVRGPLCRFLVRDLCLVQVLVQILVRSFVRAMFEPCAGRVLHASLSISELGP